MKTRLLPSKKKILKDYAEELVVCPQNLKNAKDLAEYTLVRTIGEVLGWSYTMGKVSTDNELSYEFSSVARDPNNCMYVWIDNQYTPRLYVIGSTKEYFNQDRIAEEIVICPYDKVSYALLSTISDPFLSSLSFGPTTNQESVIDTVLENKREKIKGNVIYVSENHQLFNIYAEYTNAKDRSYLYVANTLRQYYIFIDSCKFYEDVLEVWPEAENVANQIRQPVADLEIIKQDIRWRTQQDIVKCSSNH